MNSSYDQIFIKHLDGGMLSFCVSAGKESSPQGMELFESWKNAFRCFPSYSRFFEGRPASPVRLTQQWEQSRWCLLQALKPFQPESAEFLSLSLSHCSGGSAAAVFQTAVGQKRIEIGVDIEASDREISLGVLNKIADSAEKGLGLKPMDLWIAKESLFKAASPLGAQVLSDFQITSWDGVQGRARCTRTGLRDLGDSLIFKLFDKLFDHLSFRIGIAFVQEP